MSDNLKFYIVMAVLATCILVPLGYLVKSWQAPATRSVYYDKIEVFDAGGESAFRTPGGWEFAYALPDGTVFIKQRMVE